MTDEELLKRYRDTGLEPEEVTAIKHAIMGRETAKITEFDGIPVKRLRELAQAEKDGRLVVLDEPRKPLVWGGVIGMILSFAQTATMT